MLSVWRGMSGDIEIAEGLDRGDLQTECWKLFFGRLAPAPASKRSGVSRAAGGARAVGSVEVTGGAGSQAVQEERSQQCRLWV